MKRLSKAINILYRFAAIPEYPKCKKCGNADPYLNEDGLCYKCFDPAKKKPAPQTLPSPSYKDDDGTLDSIIKKNNLIPYLKITKKYISVLSPFSIVSFVHSPNVSDIQNKLDMADPKLIEKIIDNAALSGSHIHDELKNYCLQFDVTSNNSPDHIVISLSPYNDNNTNLYEYPISKKDLEDVSSSDELNKIGVPRWFAKAFNNLSGMGALNFLRSIK